MGGRRASLFASLLLASTASLVAGNHDYSRPEARHVRRRSNLVTDASALSDQTFDYVIVGAGTAGAVIASRLTEDASVTVAVIEAGADGSLVEDQILAPGYAYFDGIASLTSDYDWHYESAGQDNLNNRSIYWPRGKVVGGSSAVNGLYMIRGSEIEHNSWQSLESGNSSWSWKTVYPYMKKSESWTAPSDANIALANMTLDASLHGLSGPIHYSYPGFFYPQVSEYMAALLNLGVAQQDPAGGQNWGAFVATSAINPDGWTRSYSKTGYLDPAANRTNLVVLTGFQATKIVFDGTTATGVEFAASASGTTYTVSASKEVILSAGVIGSPQLLQVSGVGPSDLLTGLGIDVVVDLPGVGMHLTDHLSSALVFNTTGVTYTGDEIENNATYAAEQLALWEADDASSLYNSPNDAVAYVDLVTLFGADDAATLITDIIANQSALVAAYSTDATVQAGYNATYSAEVSDIFPSSVGQAEILMSNTGTYGSYGTSKTISVQAAIQHPLSRGSVKITTTSTFDAPTIDPGYLTHPADIQILVAAFKFARTLAQTAPLSTILTDELSPGSDVSTDAEWETWLRTVLSTEYHPAGSCSMLPLEHGGVVNTEMQVYGTSNLRVIDSSMVPIGMSAHMTSPLYGLAERAYAILAADATPATTTSTSSSASESAASTTSATSTTSTTTPPASSTATVTGSGARLDMGTATALLAVAITFAVALV